MLREVLLREGMSGRAIAGRSLAAGAVRAASVRAASPLPAVCSAHTEQPTGARGPCLRRALPSSGHCLLSPAAEAVLRGRSSGR